MMGNRANHIVLTTINIPDVLHSVVNNLKKFDRLGTVKCWVVGDRKTPPACADFINELKTTGLDVEFLSIEYQDEWGKVYPVFYNLIPYNNDARRIIGYLHALKENCERLIVLDDDNYLIDDVDFIGHHSTTGKTHDGELLRSPNGFFNICEDLIMNKQYKVYPRGYPFELRGVSNNFEFFEKNDDKIIGVTAGLWLDAPDVDATMWLNNGKVKGIAYVGRDVTVLSDDTWTPINTQNTSVCRDLIPAFISIPMGFKLANNMIFHRYGDIWGGYIIQAVMKGTRHHVNFGQPLVDHRRNPHNFIQDLSQELWGIMLNDWFIYMIKNVFKSKSNNIIFRMREMADFISTECVTQLPDWAPKDFNMFFKRTANVIRYYVDTCEIILEECDG